jgi:hypothetical protein
VTPVDTNCTCQVHATGWPNNRLPHHSTDLLRGCLCCIILCFYFILCLFAECKKKKNLEIFGVLHAVPWAKNILWARPCLSVCLFVFFLQV